MNPINRLKILFYFLFCFFLISNPILEAVNPSQNQINDMSTRVVTLINNERAKHGLPKLSQIKVLAYYAVLHSQNMSDGKVKFGHEGFKDRAEKIYRGGQHISFAENVAYNYNYNDPLAKAVDGWMKSSSHRENILGDFQDTGVGIAFDKDGRCFLTQLFAKRME